MEVLTIVNPFVSIKSSNIREPRAFALTIFGVTYASNLNSPANELEHDQVTNRKMKKLPAVRVKPDIQYTVTAKRIDSAVDDGT